MAAIKKSVRLVDKTIEVCANLSQSGETNWSGSLNTLADEYLVLINENVPKLTANQWNAFYCTYNGYIPTQDAEHEAKILHWHISEGFEYDEQVREFLGTQEEAITFIATVKTWSLSQRLAVIYKAKAFWAKSRVSTIIFEESK